MVSKKQIDTPLFERLVTSGDIAVLQTEDTAVKELRSEAFEYFKTNGFPSIKNEEWKFTNMIAFLKDDYMLSGIEPVPTLATLDEINTLIDERLNAVKETSIEKPYKIVLINGFLSKELSVLPESADIKIDALNDAMQEKSFQNYFGKVVNIKDAANSFAALNTALFANGLYIEVPKGEVIETPIYLFNIVYADRPSFVQPRNLVVLHENSELTIVESEIDMTYGQVTFVNKVSEVVVKQNAHYHHYDLQIGTAGVRNVQRTEAIQHQHSTYNNYTFTFPGSDVVRNNLTIHLDEANLENHLYGLYLIAGKQVTDNHTEIHHKFPNGESNQLYKGVLLDQSKAVFNGKIIVYEDAQKTNAFQQSNNLLYSTQATVNAKPQLEIFADDVKCSHGTTIGQMSEESMFYLQSRGIGQESARKLMVNAFAFDVTQKVKLAQLRAFLEDKIQATIN